MVNTKILLSVVIVLLIGVAAASYQITTNTPGLWQPTTSQDQKSPDQATSTQSEGSQSGTPSETTSTGSQTANGGSSVAISITKAKSIAQNYIEQPGATAGTPKLQTMNGTKVYIVPVIYKGEQAGEIWIDAKTGKNIGGAGGAP
jgi:uncharacterized membrane protein YkoI